MRPDVDPPEGELDGVGVADGVPTADGDAAVTDGVSACPAALDEDDGEGVGDAVGLLQPAVSTHNARAAHTAMSAICFFIKDTSVNEKITLGAVRHGRTNT